MFSGWAIGAFLVHFQPQTDSHLLFSGADVQRGQSQNRLFSFSALTSGVKSEAVENERTRKPSFVQAGSAPSAVQLGEHLCRLPAPVPPIHAPWCPWTGAGSRHTALSRSSPSSLQISAARLCFYTLYNVLQGAHRLSRMGFSLFPCWGCQFSTQYQCCFVPGPRFGAGQIIQLWRNPGVQPES